MPIEPAVFGAGDEFPFAYPEALNDPEKLLAAYFRSSNVGLAVLDTDFRFIAVNPALAEINGIPAPAHLGKTPREILGEIADAVEAGFRSVISSREPVSLELSAKLPAKDEAGHWMVHYLPIQDEKGIVTRIGAVVVEITAQKKAEETLHHLGGRLRKEMERLQMLLDVSSLLSSHSNMHQIFPRISARIRRLLRHEYAGFELHDPIHRPAGAASRRLSTGQRLAFGSAHQPAQQPARHRVAGTQSSDLLRNQMSDFEAEISKNFLDEGLRSLCCVPALPAQWTARRLCSRQHPQGRIPHRRPDAVEATCRPIGCVAGEPSNCG